MFRYVVKPVDGSETFDIMACDPAEVLTSVSRLPCASADIEKDGDYAFSIQLDDAGVWKIFNRCPC